MIPITTKEELINHLKRIESFELHPCPTFSPNLTDVDKELIKILDEMDEIPVHRRQDTSPAYKEELIAIILQKIQEHNNLS